MDVVYLLTDDKWDGNDLRHRFIYHDQIIAAWMNSPQSFLSHLVGKFAVVTETDDRVYLAVDSISSFPLFYHCHDNKLYISDSAETIARLCDAELDEKNILEFLKTGYVTESETVFRNIYSLKAGEWMYIDKRNGEIIKKQWFSMKYEASDTIFAEKLIDGFDSCLEEVFADYIKILDGRMTLLPLSGGCDSRTIAVLLKRLKYDNVVCFSYGRKGNFEAERSKTIAEALGYRWIFVEYNSEVWRSTITSDTYKNYLAYSCKGRGIGCLQALPAIISIRQNKEASDAAVVIPGHALDFTLGSHLSNELLRMDKKGIVDHIIHEHYCLRSNQKEIEGTEKWIGKISNNIKGTKCINEIMKWEWINRQSHFIANDVRAYEYAGYDYELPFWDLRIQRWAMKLPPEMLIGRKFQYLYTSKKIDTAVGLSLEYGNTLRHSFVKSSLKQVPLIYEIIKRRNARNIRNRDTNGFLSWLTDDEYKYYEKLLGVGYNLNSIEANDYISFIKNEKR